MPMRCAVHGAYHNMLCYTNYDMLISILSETLCEWMSHHLSYCCRKLHRDSRIACQDTVMRKSIPAGERRIEIEVAGKRYVCVCAYIYAYTVSLWYAKFNKNAVDFVACGERARGYIARVSLSDSGSIFYSCDFFRPQSATDFSTSLNWTDFRKVFATRRGMFQQVPYLRNRLYAIPEYSVL